MSRPDRTRVLRLLLHDLTTETFLRAGGGTASLPAELEIRATRPSDR